MDEAVPVPESSNVSPEGMKKFTVSLETTGVVNERTGEAITATEAMIQLHELERAISWAEDQIDKAKTALKAARGAREDAVSALRAAIRDSKTIGGDMLPFDAPEVPLTGHQPSPDDPDDGGEDGADDED